MGNKLPEPAPDEKKPWEHIPNKKSDLKNIEIWCKGLPAREIKKEVFLEDMIRNIISDLRKSYPETRIPKETERKEK